MAEQQCKNCGNNFWGKYCNICGEKVYTEKDKTLGHIIGEGLHFLTHFEGKFFNTLKVIFLRPGKLSLDYCNGIRKKYFKPLSFFLMLVILYLLFPVFQGLNMKLEYHVTHNLYGNFASSEVASILNVTHVSAATLAESFHRAGEKTSKFLLFLIIPFVALFSWLLGYRKRKLYYDHFVFTIETCSFFILWGFLILPLFVILLNLITNIRINSENSIGFFILGVFAIYTMAASKRFFNFSWLYSILYAILMPVFLAGFIEYIYKFILFYIAIKLA
ncbi:MAG: DUF3667 domain-containing protein [Chitinophagaceae bacterium]|nr:DUF3667 domain-containing protein [Chitinophagaceae bacterium]